MKLESTVDTYGNRIMSNIRFIHDRVQQDISIEDHSRTAMFELDLLFSSVQYCTSKYLHDTLLNFLEEYVFDCNRHWT
jgi:hypothetical protein